MSVGGSGSPAILRQNPFAKRDLKKTSWIFLSLATLALGSASVFALRQAPPQVKPSPEHAIVQKMAGTWDAVVDMGGMKSKAVQVLKPVGDLWVAGSWEGDMMGQPFTGHMINGYSPEKKKFVGVWVDSTGAELSHSESTYDAATKTMTGKIVGWMDGQETTMTEVTTYRDDDHYTTKMSMVLPDGSAMPIMTFEVSRRK